MPNISSMCTTRNMRKNLLGEGIDVEANDRLIPCNPSVLGRVGVGDFLLVLIFSIKELGRQNIRNIGKTHNPGYTKGRQHLGMPV
jgi:hypothetical protein